MYGPKKMPGGGTKGKPISNYTMPYKLKPGEGTKDKPISDFTMPYKPKPGDKNSIMGMKRKELAKKKAEIIRGQNSQTAAGSDGARMESLSNIRPSNPSDRPKFRYL